MDSSRAVNTPALRLSVLNDFCAFERRTALDLSRRVLDRNGRTFTVGHRQRPGCIYQVAITSGTLPFLRLQLIRQRQRHLPRVREAGAGKFLRACAICRVRFGGLVFHRSRPTDETIGVSILLATKSLHDPIEIIAALLGDFRKIVACFLHDRVRPHVSLLLVYSSGSSINSSGEQITGVGRCRCRLSASMCFLLLAFAK